MCIAALAYLLILCTTAVRCGTQQRSPVPRARCLHLLRCHSSRRCAAPTPARPACQLAHPLAHLLAAPHSIHSPSAQRPPAVLLGMPQTRVLSRAARTWRRLCTLPSPCGWRLMTLTTPGVPFTLTDLNDQWKSSVITLCHHISLIGLAARFCGAVLMLTTPARAGAALHVRNHKNAAIAVVW